MKMKGTEFPPVRSRACNSIPDIVGMRTSAMTQHVLFNSSEIRKASADGNARTAYPSDRTRVLIAVRTDSSSSITEITGILVNITDPGQSAERLFVLRRAVRRMSSHELNGNHT
jgi:hypothetical protein